MNVSAIIVTRGDVDTDEIVNSFPTEWEVIVWDNGAKNVIRWTTADSYEEFPGWDLSVYGRYAAIEYARNDLIYVQDDDCVVSDPMAIVRAWYEASAYPWDGRTPESGPDPRDLVEHVICNMPLPFRHSFYTEHALVGFGAVFHRDAPERAFQRFRSTPVGHPPASYMTVPDTAETGRHARTCDVIFTALTPRVFVDVPVRNLDWAYGDDRMWRHPRHQAERQQVLDLALQVRDAH